MSNNFQIKGRPANCQQQTTYIPQPQPKCVYTTVWPYVSCGIQPPAECDGCYGQNFNQGKVKVLNDSEKTTEKF